MFVFGLVVMVMVFIVIICVIATAVSLGDWALAGLAAFILFGIVCCLLSPDNRPSRQ